MGAAQKAAAKEKSKKKVAAKALEKMSKVSSKKKLKKAHKDKLGHITKPNLSSKIGAYQAQLKKLIRAQKRASRARRAAERELRKANRLRNWRQNVWRKGRKKSKEVYNKGFEHGLAKGKKAAELARE